MKMLNQAFAAVALTTLALAAAMPIQAGDDDYPNTFVKMCEKSPDGKVSKAEVMKAVEKMFDKHDTRKEGKLDKKQAALFAKELMYSPGG